jgi:hypothetical protein
VKTGVQGIHKLWHLLDSGFRRNDGKRSFQTFYQTIKIEFLPPLFTKEKIPLFEKEGLGEILRGRVS